MSKKINLIGQKFGRLKVVEQSNNLHNRIAWLCKCNCGNYKVVTSTDLKTNKVRSCGCLRKETTIKTTQKNATHHLTNTRLYKIWNSMKQRCYYKKQKEYNNYGGRGIKVCDEWKKDFMSFYNWAIQNGYDENKTTKEQSIDRIDVNGNYEPNNCRLTTMKKQQNNRSNNRYIYYKNKKYTIAELSYKLNINYATLLWRINNNWKEEELSIKTNLNNKNIRRGKYE